MVFDCLRFQNSTYNVGSYAIKHEKKSLEAFIVIKHNRQFGLNIKYDNYKMTVPETVEKISKI